MIKKSWQAGLFQLISLIVNMIVISESSGFEAANDIDPSRPVDHELSDLLKIGINIEVEVSSIKNLKKEY